MRVIFKALLLGTLAAACARGGGGGGEPQLDPPQQPPALAATAGAALVPEGEREIARVHHVHLDVSVIGAERGRQVSIEFVTPKGDIYERREQALSGSAWETQALGFDLLVAGTMIDAANLSGAWQARVAVDGAPLASQTFELAP